VRLAIFRFKYTKENPKNTKEIGRFCHFVIFHFEMNAKEVLWIMEGVIVRKSGLNVLAYW
jgi:hypothetical protein